LLFLGGAWPGSFPRPLPDGLIVHAGLFHFQFRFRFDLIFKMAAISAFLAFPF